MSAWLQVENLVKILFQKIWQMQKLCG